MAENNRTVAVLQYKNHAYYYENIGVDYMHVDLCASDETYWVIAEQLD